MIVNTLRMIADALNDDEYGVNAQLATLPVDTTDTLPSSIAVIGDETQDDTFGYNRFPTALPAIGVIVDADTPMSGEVMSDNRDGTVTVLIAYANDNVDGAVGKTHTWLTFRAIQRCLRVWLSNAKASDRQRNGIQVISCLDMALATPTDNINDGKIASALRLTLAVRDTTP